MAIAFFMSWDKKWPKLLSSLFYLRINVNRREKLEKVEVGEENASKTKLSAL